MGKNCYMILNSNKSVILNICIMLYLRQAIWVRFVSSNNKIGKYLIQKISFPSLDLVPSNHISNKDEHIWKSPGHSFISYFHSWAYVMYFYYVKYVVIFFCRPHISHNAFNRACVAYYIFPSIMSCFTSKEDLFANKKIFFEIKEIKFFLMTGN